MPEYYSPGPVARAFRKSRARRTLITGPFGSGKSVSCVIKIMELVEEQKPNKDKIRKSRWGVIRNTYTDLKNTTVRTWKDWVHEPTYGKFVNVAPFEHKLRYNLSDGTSVDADIIFLALDQPKDIAKLKSLELTGAYVNEMAEIKKTILDTLDGRVGRYPRMIEGGPSWHGIVADSNMPDEDHWMYEIMEDSRNGWETYRQPGGLIKVGKTWEENPKAENTKHLVPGYYLNQVGGGKTDDWIKVFLGAQYGTLPTEGAFWANYVGDAENDGRICDVRYQREKRVDTWWDLGRTDDTAVWFTQTIRNEIHIIDYHESFGKDVPFYAKMLQDRGYLYGKHHLPHDAKAETLAAGGRSIIEQLTDLIGVGNVSLHLERDPQDRIQAARAIFDRCWFDRDKTKTGRRHLLRYRREFDDARNVYKPTPRHDDASHAADAFGLFAYNYIKDNPHVAVSPVMRNPTLNEAWDRPSMDEARI